MFYEEEFGSLAKLNCPDMDVVARNACKKAKYIYESREDVLSSLEKEDAMYYFASSSTNSKITIKASSPRRSVSFKILVYPPLRLA